MNETWVTHRARYERMLGPFGSALLEAAALIPGESVLDVGCGTASTTIAAAARVGDRGTVTGIDIDERLVAEGRRHAQDSPNAHVLATDATSFRLEKPADVAISRFGTMQFEDPVAAHQNIAANLRDGGRVACVVWRDVHENLWQSIPMQAVQKHIDLGLPGPAGGPGPFSLADVDRIAEIFEDSGLAEPNVIAVDAAVWVATDVEDALGFFDDDAGAWLRAISSDHTAAEIFATLRDELASFSTADGVRLPAAAWLVTSAKPTLA